MGFYRPPDLGQDRRLRYAEGTSLNIETGCPDDYAELFSAYFPMMIKVVAASGITPFDVEDVAMDILARFIEKDGIAYYDPDRLHDVGETPEVPGARLRKARFGSMLRGFTAVYVLQYRDKQMIRHRIEPWRNEYPVHIRGQREPVTWLEANYAEEEDGRDPILDVETSISIVQSLKAARKTLVEQDSSRDYEAFFDMCVMQAFDIDKVVRKSLGESLGISPHLTSLMVQDLRDTLTPLLG